MTKKPSKRIVIKKAISQATCEVKQADMPDNDQLMQFKTVDPVNLLLNLQKSDSLL